MAPLSRLRRLGWLTAGVLGIYLAFGPGSHQPVSARAGDTDFDGLPDNLDACWLVAAATPDGCPVDAPMNANYDGAGQAELVFTHRDTSQTYAWLMSGTTFFSGEWLRNKVDPGWKVVGTSDFTGEGMPDLLWQNEQTGQVRLFKMTYFSKVGEQLDLNYTTSSTPSSTVVDPNWRIEGTGDFNRDGHADIIWHDHGDNSGCCANVVIDYMGVAGDKAIRLGGRAIKNGDLPAVPLPLHIVGTIDFDDTNPPYQVRDLVVQNAVTGDIYINSLYNCCNWELWMSAMTKIARVDPLWHVRAIGNYAGDSREDLVFQHQTTGQMYVWARSGTGFVPYGYLSPFAVNPAWELAGPR